MSKKLVNNRISAKKCAIYTVLIGLFSGALALPASAGGDLTDRQIITQLNTRVLEQQRLIETQKRELEELKNQIAFEQKPTTETQATQTDLPADGSLPNVNNATNCIEDELKNIEWGHTLLDASEKLNKLTKALNDLSDAKQDESARRMAYREGTGSSLAWGIAAEKARCFQAALDEVKLAEEADLDKLLETSVRGCYSFVGKTGTSQFIGGSTPWSVR